MSRELHAAIRLLLVAFVATVGVLVLPAAAQAAAVPMCGELAQTIAAPPIILPGKGHVLDRVPCPDHELFQFGGGPSDGPRPTSTLVDDAPLRARPTAFAIALAPPSERLSVGQDVAKPLAGFASSLERPPRSSSAAVL